MTRNLLFASSNLWAGLVAQKPESTEVAIPCSIV